VSVRTFVIQFYYGSGSCSSSGTVINYGSGSDFLARYGSGSTGQKVMVFMVPVPQRCQIPNLTQPTSEILLLRRHKKLFKSVALLLIFNSVLDLDQGSGSGKIVLYVDTVLDPDQRLDPSFLNTNPYNFNIFVI
jgi:hypothetical protein